jgi:hypothetical protein
MGNLVFKLVNRTLLILLFCGVYFQGFSQEKFNKLSVNPVQCFIGHIYNLEYERGFKLENTDYGFSFLIGRTGFQPRIIDGYKINMAEFNLSYKMYTESFNKSSFWYSGQISVISTKIDDLKSVQRVSNIGTLGISAKEGYQLFWKSCYVDFNMNLMYVITHNLFGIGIYEDNVKNSKWIFRLGFRTGIIF